MKNIVLLGPEYELAFACFVNTVKAPPRQRPSDNQSNKPNNVARNSAKQ